MCTKKVGRRSGGVQVLVQEGVGLGLQRAGWGREGGGWAGVAQGGGWGSGGWGSGGSSGQQFLDLLAGLGRVWDTEEPPVRWSRGRTGQGALRSGGEGHSSQWGSFMTYPGPLLLLLLLTFEI